MAAWTTDELDALDHANEVRVAGRRKDGTTRTLTIIWHVVVDGVLYARSVRGPEGQWYRGVSHHHEGVIAWADGTRDVRFTRDADHDAQIDAAYAAKYGNGEATRRITSEIAKQTTLRIDPR